MTAVIIAADEGDKKMWRTLPLLLTRRLAAAYAWDIGGTADPPVIMSPDEARKIIPECAVIICNSASSAPGSLPARTNAVAVVDSANAGAVGRIGKSGLPAITCGLSARDTLTLPSFAPDSAVLGVQRSITCFDGSLIEPQEIPLRLSGAIDSFVLMAAAAVFLLTGNAGLLRGSVI